jgi:DMSO/TMAO reductase YedYZ heme-binding membrane subunit
MPSLPDLWKRHRVWIILTILLIAVSIFLPKIPRFPFSTVQLAAWLGIACLVLTLLPNNLLKFPSVRVSFVTPLLTFLVRFRRSIGITAGLLFVFHGSFVFFTGFAGQLNLLFLQPILPGFITFLLFVILLITSNKPTERWLGMRWKPIQRLVWLAIPLAFTHSLLASTGLQGALSWVGLIGFGALLLFVLIENIIVLFRPEPDPVPRTHLLFMLVGVVIAFLLFTLGTKLAA